QVVAAAPLAFTRDDVDRAGNGLRAGFRGGRTQDLDALDLRRVQRVDREARWQPFAVEQDERVAAAQAPHADGATTARRALHRDAGQALEQLAHAGVAEALDLLAPDHDLRCGAVAALAHLVALALTADLHP